MEYKFGTKLKQVRERRQMTLKELATQAKVSISLISQIENNKISPAIDTLLRIVDILEIDLEYLFSGLRKKKKVDIVSKEERKKIKMENVFYEQLSKTQDSLQEHSIEAYYIEIEKEGEKGNLEYGHIGKELGIIIEGEGSFIYGDKEYLLKEGDSISFSSDIPHRLKNNSDQPLKAYWITTPPKMFINPIS